MLWWLHSILFYANYIKNLLVKMVGVSSSIILLSFFLMFTYLFVMWNGEIYGSQKKDDICCRIFIFMNIIADGVNFYTNYLWRGSWTWYVVFYSKSEMSDGVRSRPDKMVACILNLSKKVVWKFFQTTFLLKSFVAQTSQLLKNQL